MLGGAQGNIQRSGSAGCCPTARNWCSGRRSASPASPARSRARGIPFLHAVSGSAWARSSRKNGADIRMTVDAAETLIEYPSVDAFMLAGGDSDFSPLVSKLRELGKHESCAPTRNRHPPAPAA
ncbi:NYN domain-containing protein [Amycolatopsis sp. A133]|uniref:NYN domain-containing protein n=1 Tax=Amycolatopsis sp. A133 TaxID=3064472 RepID=UPI00280012BD|nr:NYN domain-containing protein [Amycolatopsis sp. A133]MDQ7809088.1 NYN domain-containing protein [Amycolatopsis sp. A133]